MTDFYIARSAKLAARKLDGQMIILSGEDSGLFVLNEVGTALWESADGITPLSSIIDRVICPAYDVDAATVLKDALEFIEALGRHGVLHVSGEPIADPLLQELES